MWKSREEITKTYTDHLESLTLSGIEFDEAGLRRAWQQELEEWDKTHSTGLQD